MGLEDNRLWHVELLRHHWNNATHEISQRFVGEALKFIDGFRLSVFKLHKIIPDLLSRRLIVDCSRGAAEHKGISQMWDSNGGRLLIRHHHARGGCARRAVLYAFIIAGR